MSQENVAIVRGAFAAFNRRDLVGAAHAIEGMWREVLKDVPDFHIDFVRVVADSPEVSVIEVEFRGMGRASGADILTRVQGFRGADDALEAVGLRG